MVRPLRLANQISQRTNYMFTNTSLLQEALTHPSVVTCRDDVSHIKNSERLEFLGDTVLNLVVSDMLFRMYPEEKQGQLSKRRKHLVDGQTLAKIGKDMQLCNLIIKDIANGGKCNDATLENAVEALVGAIYIDGGFDKAKEFILQKWERLHQDREDYVDPKSELQEWSFANKYPLPSYRTIAETGPMHDRRFTVRVNVYYLGTATAISSSKKQAHKMAAALLLKKLKNLDLKKVENNEPIESTSEETS